MSQEACIFCGGPLSDDWPALYRACDLCWRAALERRSAKWIVTWSNMPAIENPYPEAP